jgi:hypothetical protein
LRVESLRPFDDQGFMRNSPVVVQFVEDEGVYTGASPSGRCWRISRVFTGWRLEFRDYGDTAATFAGVHHSVGAAQAEAGR